MIQTLFQRSNESGVNNPTYFFKILREWFFPDSLLKLHPENLRTTLRYQSRRDDVFVDPNSCVGPVKKMKFVTDKPGRYIGTGEQIRRVE